MLKNRLIHPEILRALASAGHTSRVLIADGNFPVSTETSPTAARVFLNLRPGLVTVTDVLDVLVESIPIEGAMVMATPDDSPVPVHERFRSTLPAGIPFSAVKRADFYAEARAPRTALVIATGEQRRFANLLLTVGVVFPPADVT